ncbi:MAG: hypothetical protein IPG99_03585 [Ignavibacteria bacterium]|nr:hypothetical protein [Ignavibacteria bacterium]
MNMKKLLAILSITLISITASGCEVIGNIFQAGIWVGIIVIVAVVAVIAFIVRLFAK